MISYRTSLLGGSKAFSAHMIQEQRPKLCMSKILLECHTVFLFVFYLPNVTGLQLSFERLFALVWNNFQ